jgi:hypothetical protein
MKYRDAEISTFQNKDGWGGFARISDWTVRLSGVMVGPETAEKELKEWVDFMYEHYWEF